MHTDRSSPWTLHGWIDWTRMMLDSYAHWLGRELIPREGSDEDQARTLYLAPFVVVSHGVQSDPILRYGNAKALELWEMDAQTLMRTPSRLTAEPMHRDERDQLLARTTRDGYVDDYRGIRISSTGKPFRIEEAIVWNLIAQNGNYAGQAATFSRWTPITKS